MSCFGKNRKQGKNEVRSLTRSEIEEQDYCPKTFDELFTVLDQPNKSVEEFEQEKEDIINQIQSIKGEGSSAQLVQEFKTLADDMISMQQRLGAAVWALHIVNEEIYRTNTDKKVGNGTSNNL